MESRIILSCLCSALVVQLSLCQQTFMLRNNGIRPILGQNRLLVRQNNIGGFQQTVNPLNNRLGINRLNQFNNNGLRVNQRPLNNFQVGLVRQAPVVNRINNLGSNQISLRGLNLNRNGLQRVNLGVNNLGLNRMQIGGNGLSMNQLGGNGLTTQFVGNGLAPQMVGNGLATQMVGNGMVPMGGNGMVPMGGNGMVPMGGNGMVPMGGNGMVPMGGNGMGFNQGGLMDVNMMGFNQGPMLFNNEILEKQLKLRKKINKAIQEVSGV